MKNKTHYNQALARINELWGAKRNTEKGDQLDILMLLVEKYEEEHYPIPPSDPVEAIKFLMEQKGLTRKDLEPYLGTRARVSEVLNKKRNLTLPMIKKLHEGLNIPYNCLIA
ncbi:MAG: helix-turn-helix domain-containing protein [Pseudomonadota bacterium]